MNRFLGTLGLAAALCCGGAAHASLLDFNNPGLIDIDNNTGLATYGEAGYVITGPAASFLPIDGAMVGGFDTTAFTLGQMGGGSFTLQSLDLAAFDLGFGPGTLVVSGLVGNTQVASRSLDLGSAGSVSFGSAWADLTSVSFTATGGFALDNISAVPEPAGFVLAGAGLLFIAAVRRRR